MESLCPSQPVAPQHPGKPLLPIKMLGPLAMPKDPRLGLAVKQIESRISHKFQNDLGGFVVLVVEQPLLTDPHNPKVSNDLISGVVAETL